MLKKHSLSFRNAFSGLVWIFKTQPNFKIHISLALFSLLAGFFFRVSYSEFLIILVLIIIGFVIEAVNTAIEETIDAIHKNWSAEIKIAKDVSAASMLIFAIGAATIAGIIFIPRILTLLSI